MPPIPPQEFDANPPKVEELIKSATLVVIGLGWCPIVARAKDTIENYVPKRHPQYKVFDLEDKFRKPLVPDVEKYREELTQLYGSRTVPKVFLSGILLGGADDTVALHRSGELRQKLIDAGIIKEKPVTPPAYQ